MARPNNILIGCIRLCHGAAQIGLPGHPLKRLFLALDPISRLISVKGHLANDTKSSERKAEAGDELDPAVNLKSRAHLLFLAHFAIDALSIAVRKFIFRCTFMALKAISSMLACVAPFGCPEEP